jgi:hypothetical protein
VELLGLMDTLLDELEAGDLAREEYKELRTDGVAVLKDMLRAPVQQLLLTPFDRPLFSDIAQPSPQPPPTLPETSNLPPTMPTENMPVSAKPPSTEEEVNELLFDSSIPIFFARKPRDTKKPRPPVPALPGDDEDE